MPTNLRFCRPRLAHFGRTFVFGTCGDFRNRDFCLDVVLEKREIINGVIAMINGRLGVIELKSSFKEVIEVSS